MVLLRKTKAVVKVFLILSVIKIYCDGFVLLRNYSTAKLDVQHHDISNVNVSGRPKRYTNSIIINDSLNKNDKPSDISNNNLSSNDINQNELNSKDDIKNITLTVSELLEGSGAKINVYTSTHHEDRSKEWDTDVILTMDYYASVNNVSTHDNETEDYFDELLEKNSTAVTSYYQLWLDKFEKSGYDKNVRPFHGVKPIEVVVSIHVIRVHSISETTMDYGIDIYYRENWTDPRLAYNRSEYGGEFLNMPSSATELIWFPDTYFSNAIRAETDFQGSVTHRSLVRLYPSGNVYYVRKISLTAECPMDISMYPFDKQGCKLVMCSYSYLKKDLYYTWRHGDPIDFQEHIRLPEFKLVRHRARQIDEHYHIGTYSTLHLCLVFKRNAGFCIIQVFFPATAIVISSWVSLWLAEETQFSDLLGVILAIIFLALAYNSVMPRVSYLKLLDMFLASCFLFIFLSLTKLVVLKYWRKNYEQKESTDDDRTSVQVLDEIILAQAESSAIGSSDDDEDLEKGKRIKPRQNHNNNNKKNVGNGKLTSYNQAKKMLQRKVTLAKIEFDNKQRKEKEKKRFLRNLHIFHVVTQLVMPIGFISFFVFILIAYPNWPRQEPC